MENQLKRNLRWALRGDGPFTKGQVLSTWENEGLVDRTNIFGEMRARYLFWSFVRNPIIQNESIFSDKKYELFEEQNHGFVFGHYRVKR